MKDEKTAFAERVREAMRAQGLAPKAAELERLFNTHYRGRPVSQQSVSAWLRGVSMPKPDKVRALANVLGVDPRQLHYGESGTPRVEETAAAWAAGVNAEDRATFDALLTLPHTQRKLIGELIRALASARD